MGWRALNLSGLEYGQVAGSCENGNENLGFIKYSEILEYLRIVNLSRSALPLDVHVNWEV